MIEHAYIKSQLRLGATTTDLAMAQFLHYKCFAKYTKSTATQRLSRDREPLFPVLIMVIGLCKGPKEIPG